MVIILFHKFMCWDYNHKLSYTSKSFGARVLHKGKCVSGLFIYSKD